MSDQPGPQPPRVQHQDQIRTGARVAGIALTVLGAVLMIGGLVVFGSAFAGDYDPFASDGIPRPVFGLAGFAAGGFALVFGRGLLGVGYGGAALRYAAGEAAPVIKETADHVRGTTGTTGDPAAGTDGPFCRACGVRNRADAKFCDGCGQSLA